MAGTGRISPHLHFGEITARQVWHYVSRSSSGRSAAEASWMQTQFVSELGWREFAYHLLCHYPHTPTRPLRPEFERFPWNGNAVLLKAWQRGQTGYPMVDAGMRELWTTGWMHNRVRMVVASFLVKHLMIHWQEGARWFWDTLVDADLASNSLGWQWTAGCGADAAPFFRIFNPVNQGEKFDHQGEYVRRWVPELAGLTPEWIHKPWAAPALLLQQANVDLGRTYPVRIVDHAAARTKALAAYEQLQRRKSIIAPR
jgi:deoxyribodipyrimidine photo-lyase